MGAGEKLLQAWGGKSSALAKPVTELLKLRRPKGVAFTWANVSLIVFYISLVRRSESVEYRIYEYLTNYQSKAI